MNTKNEILPVQELLRNVLQVTLGASPSVYVSEPRESIDNFYNIDIMVDNIEMAINLSIITISNYSFQDIQISINFYVTDCDEKIFFSDLIQSSSVGALIDIINSAFSDNPLYVFAAAPTDSVVHDEDLYLVFIPHVLQYSCNNQKNLFGNCSNVAADLFRRVIYNNFFSAVSTGFSTNTVNTI